MSLDRHSFQVFQSGALFAMGKYAYEPDSASEQEVAKARGTALAIHFKHTREIMHTIKGMKLSKAKKFLAS